MLLPWIDNLGRRFVVSGLCLKLVGRFGIPILDSGRIKHVLDDEFYKEPATVAALSGPDLL